MPIPRQFSFLGDLGNQRMAIIFFGESGFEKQAEDLEEQGPWVPLGIPRFQSIRLTGLTEQ